MRIYDSIKSWKREAEIGEMKRLGRKNCRGFWRTAVARIGGTARSIKGRKDRWIITRDVNGACTAVDE